jgi:hypothetical protein
VREKQRDGYKERKIIYGLQIMICISFNVMGCSTNEYKIPTLANVDTKIHNPVWVAPVCG